jgi:hypothetical protein
VKFPAGIEVSGLLKIVIDNRWVWQREHPRHIWWMPSRTGQSHCKYPDDMARYIHALLKNPKRRAWVHGDTLNVVMKEGL